MCVIILKFFEPFKLDNDLRLLVNLAFFWGNSEGVRESWAPHVISAPGTYQEYTWEGHLKHDSLLQV